MDEEIGRIFHGVSFSPLSIDAHAYSEDDLLHHPRLESTQTSSLNALIKVAGILIWGTDLNVLVSPTASASA
jgi:hypothetical protein